MILRREILRKTQTGLTSSVSKDLYTIIKNYLSHLKIGISKVKKDKIKREGRHEIYVYISSQLSQCVK